MKKVKARMNGGLWKAHCPKHGTAADVLAEPNDKLSIAFTENGEYICPVCHPKYYTTINARIGGVVVKKYDRSARKTGYLLAKKANAVYQVVFPPEKLEIEKILSVRKEIDPITGQRIGANWDVGETLDFLRNENKQLGLV